MKVHLALLGPALLAACTTPPDQDDVAEWAIQAIGPNDVRSSELHYDVADGSIIGGFDGCNAWQYRDRTSPITVGDAQECEANEWRDVYWEIATRFRNEANWSEAQQEIEYGDAAILLSRATR